MTKPKPRRARGIMHALDKFAVKTREGRKADKAAARVERERLKLERQKLKDEERASKHKVEAARLSRGQASVAAWTAKDAEREARIAAHSRRAVPLETTVVVQAPAAPPPKSEPVALPPSPPKPEILETVTFIDGKIIRKPLLGPDGMPRLKYPAPAAPVRETETGYVLPAAPPATPSESFGSTPAVLTPIWVRERRAPTKAELAAQHQQMSTGSTFGGFADPCGIVSAAIARERSSGRTVHVTGPWPGSKF